MQLMNLISRSVSANSRDFTANVFNSKGSIVPICFKTLAKLQI
jgi:hypothetical protein